MQELIAHGAVRGYGYGSLIAWARWAPTTATLQVITGAAGSGIDSFGIKTITRNSIGNYTAALQDKPPGLIAYCEAVSADWSTNLHVAGVYGINLTLGTVSCIHRTNVWASAAALALSDTADFLQLFVYARQPL